MNADRSKNAVAIFNKHADKYQNKFMYLDLYNDSFDLFCKNVKKQGAEILELACGPGNITQYILKQRPDFKILGSDLSPNMIQLAETNNPTAKFQIMDCRDIDRITKKYDAILCGFGFPYLSKEEAIKFIGDASKILDRDGVLYISTMENDYTKSGFKKGSAGDEIFIHYHEAGYLTEALGKNDFSIIDLRRQEYPEDDGTLTIDLIIIACKI